MGNTAQQCRLWLFQDPDFARDLEDSKSTSGGMLCIFGRHTFVPISWMCKKRTFFHTVQRNLKLFLLMLVYAWMEFPLLIFAIWLLKCCILLPTNSRNPKREYRETCCVTHHQASTPISKPKIQFTTILNCVMLIMFRRTRSLLILVQCSTFLRTTMQWLKWSSRAGVQQWEMYPGPT